MSSQHDSVPRLITDEEHSGELQEAGDPVGDPEAPGAKRAKTSHKAAPRSRRWAFTLFGEDLDAPRAHFAGLIEKDSLSYICFQQEVCPKSGRSHLQGYLEFYHGRTLRGVKRVLGQPSVHLGQARDSPDTNRSYCSKPGGTLFAEYGTIAPGQGWRSDLDAVRESICGGVTGLDLWDAHFGSCVRYHKAFDRYQQLLESRKRSLAGPYLKKQITYLCGPTKSGKTSRALDICIRRYGFDAVYVRPNTVGSATDWFENMQSHHRAMIIDEFDSDIKFRNMLRVLDGYPHQVERKGITSISVDNIKEIFITSNKSPHEVYPRIPPHLKEPFFRRIDEYYFMDRWLEDRCKMPESRIHELRRS